MSSYLSASARAAAEAPPRTRDRNGGMGLSAAASGPPPPTPVAQPEQQEEEEEEEEDEVSEPFFKGMGVVFVDVDDDGHTKCNLCSFARKNPPPPYDDPVQALNDDRWGVLHNCMDNLTLCQMEEEEQHAFHTRCIRAYVLANKAHFREKPGCPVCDRSMDDLTKPKGARAPAGEGAAAAEGDADGDDLDFGVEEGGGKLFGKKRNREKQMYSVWVHVRQATGLALVQSDRTMNPVAVVSAFGKTVSTAKGDGGKTYNCVWNEAFSFQKRMDEEELSREVIQIRVEDKNFFNNTLIGFVKFEAQVVHKNKNHEFYQLQYPLMHMAGKKQAGNVSMQGQLEVSVCVLSEKDMKEDPQLPLHVYDAEVEMWAELQHKAEVVEFDIGKNFLQNALEHKAAEDAARKITEWDIVHVRVYRGEDLPKLDSRGWVDAFIELEYKGLMDKGNRLKSKPILKSMSPVWNQEFLLPFASGVPLIYDSFELVVKNHNSLSSDDWIGKCRLNISDIMALPEGAPPMWRSLYQDIDGRAPTYRGRVLLEVSVERAQKSAKMHSVPCSPCREELLPPSGSYRLDFELLEGMHLLEGFQDYQVDVTLGHSMTVGTGTGPEAQKERDKSGKAWATIESDTKVTKGANKTIVPFLTKKSLIVHNLPYPRRWDLRFADPAIAAAAGADPAVVAPVDPSVAAAAAALESQRLGSELAKLPESTPLSPTGSVKPHLGPDGTSAVGFTGDASTLSFNSVREDFNNNTCLLDYKSMMPDLILYVSKKGEAGRKQCVGYIRIPLNGLKRPTENWEHGEDLTVFPYLWSPSDASARALPLKPLKELYQLTSGFLLFKATLEPVSGVASMNAAAQHATTKLLPVPRQRYRFVTHVLQGKDMASVDPSGLSSPFVTVQIGDVVVKSKPKLLTNNPLWFEALEAEVDLPVDLKYAPDFAATCYHFKEGFMFKFNDKSTFMGRADVPAHYASQTQEMSPPAWYPLQFEEHQYGNILLSFRLTPVKDGGLSSSAVLAQTGLERLIGSWENYAVEISALDIRGKMGVVQAARKVDPVFQIECWDDVQNFQSSKIAGEKFTVYIRRPADPVFYSAINVRIYEGKELKGVTSIPINRILKTGMGWYKLLEILMREESMTAKRVLRQWRRFVRRKKFVDPRTIRKEKKGVKLEYGAQRMGSVGGVASPSGVDEEEEGESEERKHDGDSQQGGGLRDHRFDSESGDEDVAPSTAAGSRFVYKPRGGDQTLSVPLAANERTSLRPEEHGGYSTHDITVNLSDSPGSPPDSHAIDLGAPTAAGGPAPRDAIKPRLLDAQGNEVFEEKDLRYLQCEQLPNVDAGNPFEMHWRVGCEYELLPLVSDPFTESELFVGKDEIHATFLDRIFARGKRSVGSLRGHFYGYRIGAMPKRGAESGSGSMADPAAQHRVNPLFDAEKYFAPTLYCVRVYILRGLQLIAKKGRAGSCDPFVSVSMAGGETHKTDVLDGTQNPQFYKCFDFKGVTLPHLQSTLTLSVYNDATILSADLIGTTEIALENRLFSKPWNAGQKPIERRALKKSKSGRLPQGFLEVVVQILPMHEEGNRSLDYLLNPPRRLPWELRVTLWNCRKVTMKKIYKNEGDCCCYDCLAPPNQSDIKLLAGMSGSKQPPQFTDTHPRSIDGTGNFNWRCAFDVELPSPQMLSNLKVQIWNINWNPDDCLAEAVIPLWGFFEMARRRLEQADRDFPGDPLKRIARIPRQWVHLTHPQNSDQGEVEMEVELLPKEVATRDEFKAALGEQGFKPALNAPSHLLAPPNRPDSSFPWYRLDLQILWRCKYMWRKIRWYVLAVFLIGLALIIGMAYVKAKGII